MICKKARKADNADAGGADDRGQGPHLGPAGRSQPVAVLGNLDDPAGNEVDHQDQDPGVERNKQQLGQAGVEKFLYIGEPFLIQAAEKRRSGFGHRRREAKEKMVAYTGTL